MSGQPLKRSHSPEPHQSVKRPNQDTQLVSQLAAAKRLLLRAGDEGLYKALNDLIESDASSKEIQACYTPVFKELAQLIDARTDIPVPSSDDYCLAFHSLSDPDSRLRSKKVSDMDMKRVLKYIETQDRKIRSDAISVRKPHPSYIVGVMEKAWNTDYVGNAHELLQEAVEAMYNDRSCGNFCSIIQGSGSGKSRLVDKLAESVFTIPMVLRPLDGSGFPFGDQASGRALIDFFFGEKSPQDCSPLLVERHFLLFLLKTIAYAEKWVDHRIKFGSVTGCVAAEWKKYIGPSLSLERLEMYTAAITPTPFQGFENILDLGTKYDTLTEQASAYVRSVVKKMKSLQIGFEPLIVFYFDEAHHLSKETMRTWFPKYTAYQHLCKALTYIRDAPVFALFLSRYPTVSDSVPHSPRNFWSWSSRPMVGNSEVSNDNMHAPFVELPFDAWKEPVLVTEGGHSAQEICSLKFMSRFGRPMFWALFEILGKYCHEEAVTYAASKLNFDCEDAARAKPYHYRFKELIPSLAVRLDLTFETNRDEAVFLESLLVGGSMRTVYSIPRHRQYLRGGYSSEPFVAAAAAYAMMKHLRVIGLRQEDAVEGIRKQYKTEIPSAIMAWLKKGLIDKRNRGRLIAKILCTLAHDIYILSKPDHLYDICGGDFISFSQMTPVVDFLRTLIAEEHIEKVLNARPSNLKGKTLKDAFENACVHFTQFVKAGDKLTITDEVFYLLFLRGAAIHAYENLNSVDVAIPVWIRSSDNPDRWCMTAIFIQVKNKADEHFVFIDAQETFEFFTKPKIPEHEERPYITIAMELGALAQEQKKARQPSIVGGFTEQERETPTIMPATSKANTQDSHPRYEILIKGCSKQVYNVIGTVSYSDILAHEDMLAEHPRSNEFLEATRQMKPYWVANSSYHWATVMGLSRLGANVDAGGSSSVEGEVIDCDDTDEVDGVEVNEYTEGGIVTANEGGILSGPIEGLATC